MREIVDLISLWAIPVMLVGIPLVGLARGVKVYEVFVDGAKEGFDVAVRIIPFLVAILVAIGMFRASGAMDLLTEGLLATTIGTIAAIVATKLLQPFFPYSSALEEAEDTDIVIDEGGRDA